MNEIRECILRRVTDYYLATEEFNGLSASQLITQVGEADCTAAVEQLVSERLISLNFGNFHPNPHIKAFPARFPDEQIATMHERGSGAACVYPERGYLERIVDRGQYQGRPYTLALALGDAELSHRAFDLAVLERYRNDPRYVYRNDDVSGMISIHDEFFGPGKAPERDQISLQTFGFCFDDDSNCYVAVFNRYLANLSPEHQQYWSGFEIEKPTRLHPEYFRPSILGEFPENISVYAAVLREMQAVNDLAGAIKRPRFFREDFRIRDEPPHFVRLVRPTAHEFGQFVHALDRMLSDNIDVDFFGEDVPREREIERADGRIEVQKKRIYP